MITPSKKDFLKIMKSGKPPPLYKETPYIHPRLIYDSFVFKNSFLLESIKGPLKIARFSFIGFDPYAIFKVKNNLVEIETYLCLSLQKEKLENSESKTIITTKPFGILRELVTSYKQLPFEHLPPFQGGAVGVLSYDFVHYFEKLPKNAIDDLSLPDAHFLMIDKLVAFDHKEKKSWIIVCPGARNSGEKLSEWSVIYDEAEDEIEKIFKKIFLQRSQLPKKIHNYRLNPKQKIEILYEMKKDEYIDIVKRAKEYIATGDIFQANLSQRLSAYIGDIDRWNIYRTLSAINPAPFAAYLDFGDYQIVSSSPERLLRVKDKIIETRPIAGTRPRGKNYKEDESMRAELLLNEKERAEHIMLVDLERNDLGKVSDYGTVKVDEFMITEDCSHVIHIVSNITGRISERKDCFDAIKSAFPGGTITGVPKIRCMEIIDELEPVRRGPYTGSLGYISFSGNIDLNIIIRTFVIKDKMAYVQAGAGIVADSDPEREYHETLKKAEALIKTIERVG